MSELNMGVMGYRSCILSGLFVGAFVHSGSGVKILSMSIS